MTSIIDSLNSPSTLPKTNTPQLGQEDFLKLMVTQLTTQDPFNPVENTEMVAQMAQFSSVAGIAELNQSMKTIAAGMAPGRLTDAASWIGRSMLVEADVAAPLSDGGYAGEIALPENVDQLSVSLVDANGTIVHTENLGAQTKGSLTFGWSGKDEAGQTVANGPLQVVVNATAGGQAVTPAVATWTMIGGIQSPASGSATQLVTGLGLLSADDAIRLG